MGAKQSKRSVDISGKEAESAGEVAAAGAGGEGRVEPIADADALKPQLNGDAHIQPPQELSDKEKQLDSGTPENEKDATTEKEGKEEPKDEKETTPVTNGDGESKEENGDSVPTPEDGKKPKKEKVKKKWSLRSISFSRKDKPKQEKKSKEEEPKTNGDTEKVPEEAAEVTPENGESKIAEIVPGDAEVKEEKTPETPVTEPLTNGSSSPETPEQPPAAPAAPAPALAPALAPEQLPVNGLSLEEPKQEPEVAPIEESKPEETKPAAMETVAVPEIPVKTEVCDAKMPLIEPTPPPLPANPPPSSVASFAVTTMAPELIEASLANTTENLAPPTISADKTDDNETEPQETVTNVDLAVTQVPPSLKETVPENLPVKPTATEAETVAVNADLEIRQNESTIETVKLEFGLENVTNEAKEEISKEKAADMTKTDEVTKEPKVVDDNIFMEVEDINLLGEKEDVIVPTDIDGENIPEVHSIKMEIEEVIDTRNADSVSDATTALSSVTTNSVQSEAVEANGQVAGDVVIENKELSIKSCALKTSEPASDVQDNIDDLPPPPPLENDVFPSDAEETEILVPGTEENVDHDLTNGVADDSELAKITNLKRELVGSVVDAMECDDSAVPVAAGAEGAPPAAPAAPAAAAPRAPAGSPPQDALPIADKIADLIPEIPTVPQLKTETEQSNEVAVAE